MFRKYGRRLILHSFLSVMQPNEGGEVTWCESPLCTTLFLAISHRSQVLSFHSWAAIAYSSISGSCQEMLGGKVQRSMDFHTSTHIAFLFLIPDKYTCHVLC